MAQGCGCASKAFDGASTGYRRVLIAVIAINAAMFITELTSSFIAQSQALQADALDFLGDTLTYGVTLAVIGLPLAWRATAALAKGVSLAVLALVVLGFSLYRFVVQGSPEASVIGAVGLLALLANLIAALLLFRFRNGDANVRSVWLCSRNDAINNLAVIAAAAGVAITGTAWPDLAVALVMAALFMSSSLQIIRSARRELRPGLETPESARCESTPA
ncbi:cation transporter [Defluviicoccus vanus]|uniref:Cation transporter n=1 Tax=Defluviicoccus vanus TaxID=111831 RepID=A0A7H1N1P1_9PROT|nr:cation transporter [Defluviicoccus vanus]QNT69627.1 cation transporter [Defluviicoccus vanus]